MAYLKKRYREMIERMNTEFKLPKGWSYFVKKENEKDNFIIKTKGICTCGNCQTEFKSEKKINEVEKCPKCKHEYLIKRCNYKWHDFKPRILVLLNRFEENWVVRLFETETRYSNGKIYHSNAAEFGRVILPEDLNLVNNRLYSGMFGEEKINPYIKIRKWREYCKGYYQLPTDGKLFPNNLKELFENTDYKYSQLWTLAKKVDNMDIVYYLNNNLPSTEILVKMGLYKLALCPKTFNKQGNFEQRFGLDKTYYRFMKKYNIDIDELHILKLYKKMNIKGIRYLRQFKIEDLNKIAKYMTLDKFIEFVKTKNEFDIRIYLDYIGFLEDLQLNVKDKKYLFPEDIKQEQDKYQKQVEVRKDQIIRRKIKERYKTLQKNTFSSNKYFIIPAKSINELEDESKQQDNCVRTYAKDYSNGKCDIYFMREKDKPNKSLVTVEVKQNKVVQSRTKYNGNINKTQERFLKKWEDKVLKAA